MVVCLETRRGVLACLEARKCICARASRARVPAHMLRRARLCACLRAGGARAGLRVRATGLHIGVPRSLRGSVPRDVQVSRCVLACLEAREYICARACPCPRVPRLRACWGWSRLCACLRAGVVRADLRACVRASVLVSVRVRACERACWCLWASLHLLSLSLSLCGTAQASLVCMFITIGPMKKL